MDAEPPRKRRRKRARYPDVIKAAQLIARSMRLAQKSGAKLAVGALAAVLLPVTFIVGRSRFCVE